MYELFNYGRVQTFFFLGKRFVVDLIVIRCKLIYLTLVLEYNSTYLVGIQYEYLLNYL